jgi:hypothetical protein
MDALINKVVGLGVALLLGGTILTLGIQYIINSNTTGWDASLSTLWKTGVPVFAVIGYVVSMIFFAVGTFRGRGRR